VWHVCADVSEEPDDDIVRVENCRNLEDRCGAFFPKSWYLCTRLHGVTSQDTLILLLLLRVLEISRYECFVYNSRNSHKEGKAVRGENDGRELGRGVGEKKERRKGGKEEMGDRKRRMRRGS